jgi:hypothetical protein
VRPYARPISCSLVLVGQFDFLEWSEDHSKHPHFVAFRDDKHPRTSRRKASQSRSTLARIGQLFRRTGMAYAVTFVYEVTTELMRRIVRRII